MNKMKWCLGKREGITITEPNTDLSKAYILKAGEALESMSVNIIKDWKISTAYYTIYFSLYSLLMKIGIKCEIHSCTIEFTSRYLNEFFTQEDIEFFQKSLKARIDSQYYVDRVVSDEQYRDMIVKAPSILVNCKSILIKLTEKKVNEIRSKFQKDKEDN